MGQTRIQAEVCCHMMLPDPVRSMWHRLNLTSYRPGAQLISEHVDVLHAHQQSHLALCTTVLLSS